MPRGGRLFLGSLGFLILLAGAVGVAEGQSTTEGAIGGVVTDAAGNGIPYARISIRQAGTGRLIEGRSDDQGRYRITSLTPGDYSVEIEKATFAEYDADTVVVEVGRLTLLSPHLGGQSARETVVVKAETPELDLASPALSTNIDETPLEKLPINQRRWTNFALLTPAVVSSEAGDGQISFRGVSVRLNGNTIDGVNNNQSFFSTERGRSRIGYSTSQSSVREFQVNTSNYGAEYGPAAGGVVNTVTRSGGNELHGSAFFYDRDNAWGAQNPFTQLAEQTSPGVFTAVPVTPTDVRLQWGVAAGGPIEKDKLFWFLSYDQYRRNYPAIARVGNVTTFFDKPLTNTELQDLRQRLGVPLDAMAKQDYDQALTEIAGETGMVPRTASQLILFPKLDWQTNERNHFTVQYNRFRGNMPNGVHTGPSTTYGIASFGDVKTQEDWIVGRWSRVFRERLVNEVRYQYGRDFESEMSAPPSAFEQPFSQNVYGRSPEIRLMSYSSGIRIGKPATLDRAAYPDERRNEYGDLLTWVRGNHFVKFGYEYDHANDQVDTIYNGNGTYVYDSLVGFVSDLLSPGHCSTSGAGVGFVPCYNYFRQSLGPSNFDFSTNDYGAFVSDDWKVRRGLTLTWGVRYDYQQLPHTNKFVANPALPETLQSPHDRNNYGPRLGLAWDVFGRGRTVVRAGYGIYYARTPNATAFSALTNTGSAGSQLSYYLRPVDPGAPPFPHVFSGAAMAPVAPDVAFFDRRFQNPQVQEMEVSVGQRVRGGLDLTASFLESLGRELPNFRDTNIDLSSMGAITYSVKDPTKAGPLAATYTTDFFTQRVNPNYRRITDIFSETNSHYQAFVVKANRRMRRSFYLMASYTYAHSYDFNPNEGVFTDVNTILDPANLREEYGPSNFDARQRVTGAGVLRVPWRLRGITGALLNGYAAAPTVMLQSGLPFSMRSAGSIPSTEFVDSLNRVERLYGLANSINGSGGAERIASVGRNTYRYPGHINTDLRLSKETRFGERTRLELLAESFNVLNHQNVTHLDTVGYYIRGASSPTTNPTLQWNPSFGTVINADNTPLFRERQIQLAAKLHF